MKCQYCDKEYSDKGIAAHERACKENPKNQKEETEMEENTIKEETKVEEKAEKKAKKEAVVSVPSEGDLNRQHNSFKAQLEAEEHVDILIPPTQLYPEGSVLPIGLNGVVYMVPVGIEFPKGVPRSIYNVWKQSYEADKEARAKMKKALTGAIDIR